MLNLVSLLTGRDFKLSYDALGISYLVHSVTYYPVLFMILRISNLQKIKFIHRSKSTKSVIFLPNLLRIFGILLFIWTLVIYSIQSISYFRDSHSSCQLVSELSKQYDFVKTEPFGSKLRVTFIQNAKDKFVNHYEFIEFMALPDSKLFQNRLNEACSIRSLGYLILNGPDFSLAAINFTKDSISGPSIGVKNV